MKYILYFHLYLISHQQYTITTVVAVYQDSVSFYIYNVGYVNWKIDETTKEDIVFHNGKTMVSAIYLVSFKDLKAIVQITFSKVKITILTGVKPEIIELREQKHK